MSGELHFILNGKDIWISNPSPETLLVDYLRSPDVGLTGTKKPCGQGGCGGCTVILSTPIFGGQAGQDGRVEHRAINSCLRRLCSLNGLAITTIEGTGSIPPNPSRYLLHHPTGSRAGPRIDDPIAPALLDTITLARQQNATASASIAGQKAVAASDHPNPVAHALAKNNGSQCGYCSVGFVMNMSEFIRTNPSPSKKEIEDIFDGNLCRCTGYRPILTGMKSFAKDWEEDPESQTVMQCLEDPPVDDPLGSTVSIPVPNKWPKVIPLSTDGADGIPAWHAPTTVEELMVLWQDDWWKNPPRFIHGGTSFGIYDQWFTRDDAPAVVDLRGISDINIAPSFAGDSFYFGATLTYSQFIDHVLTYPGIGQVIDPSLEALLYMARRTAGRIVRNAATIGGNTMLVLHNIHGDTPFPSDFVTTLFALDAEVEYYEIVLQPDGSAQAVKQSSTLEAMVQKIVANPPPSEQSQNLRRYILMSYSVPLSKDNGVVLSQKVALREVNSHAIVNAATNLSFGDGLNVATARLIFGNIASFPWRASRTESALQGNELSLDLISKLCSILDEEVRAALAQWQDAFANVPDEGFTDNYKASSAVSMFYKAMLNALVKRGGKVPPHLESAGNEYWGNWPSSTGRQYYTVQDFKKPVSQPYIKGTALAQCSGQTHYTQEIAPPPRTLYAGVVQANAALGKAAFKRPGDLDATLTMDDLSEYLREQFPEFVSIISYSDIPKYGVNYQGIGLDQPLFADAIVLYVGQCLGLLIAETEEAALRITRLVNEQCVDVTQAEWDQPWNLPVLTLEDAIDRGSIFPDSPATAPWVMHVWKITRPHSQFDWMATEDGAPRHPDIVVAEHIDVGGISCTRIANSQRTGGQAHFYMETQAALAIPSDEGRMVVHSSTQSPLEIQQSVAMALSSHYNKVKIQTALLGGGFGGKTEQTRFVAAPTAVAARVLNRPVRLIVPRDQDTALIGKRHALYGECQIAVDDGTVDNKNKGLIRGLHLTMWADGGAYYDCSYIVSNCIQTRIDNAYMIPNFESQIDVCRTNTAPNTAMRSFGDIQGKTVLENAIDDAAAQLGIRPEEIREKNFYVRGDMAPYGQVLTACYIKEVWAYLKEKCDYDKKVSDVEDFNSKNKWRKRGISMIPVKYGSGYNFEQLKQSTAIIVANQADGSIVIHQGGVEMGQGLLTQVQQVAAYVLNIPLDLIHVESPQTDTTPNTTSSGASTGTPYSCEAVKRTAEILRKRLMDFGYQLLKDNGDDWCKAHGIDFWNYGLQGWAAEVSPPNMAPALIWQNIVNLAYVYRLGLTATFNIDIPQGDFDMPVLGFKPADKQPQIPGITPSSTDPSGVLNQFVGYTYSAACSVVEIDVLTGETKILSSDIVYDMGWSLNPALDIGQVEGAFIQGVGYLLTEELVTQSKPIAANYREGKLNTVNTWRYKIPAHVTIPLEMNVYLFPRNDPSVINIPPDDQGIFSAKEVGEPPLVLAISVFFAVKDAVRASRKERGKLALFRLDAPATPQEVRRACDVTLSDL